MLDDLRLPLPDEHVRTAERADVQRLVARIEDEDPLHRARNVAPGKADANAPLLHDTQHMCIIRSMATVAIVGASGYVGQETLDRVLAHPGLELYALGSDSLAGRAAVDLDPRLGRNGWSRMPRFITNEAALSCGADIVFLCLPHDEAAEVDPPSRGVVVDLSGAHRFSEFAAYSTWYGFEHPRPDELSSWSYGLPELRPPSGRLVGNPGCYATAVLLALGPIADDIEPIGAVVDAKSGMTGAGRSPQASSHAGVVLENVSPYRVGVHQQAPEIAAQLGFPVTFVPHLLPVRRGLLATCVVRSRGADLREPLEAHYAVSHVVDVLPQGVVPELARVQQTDGAEIGVFEDRLTGDSIVSCALDNLGKGAAGQAIQNVNHLYGFEETLGLRLSGVLV
jgi:N-acetyl-gamma-glutamyl-phosphate reductase